MTRQIIITPNGDRMVVLSEVEYETLLDAVEDTEDLSAIHRFERKLADGEEELIPAEYVYRMLEGESRVAVWREYRGLSAKDLADAAGISQAYLSQIESGKRDGTVSTMRKIADVLRLSIDDLT